MGGGLGAEELWVQREMGVYLISYALMSMVHGPLSDAMGRRRVLIGGLMMFVLASVGCALSASLGQLLAFRALQGLSAGVGMVVGRAVIRDTRQGDDAQRTLSQVSMIVAVAPAVAPIVGGWILGWGHWTFILDRKSTRLNSSH